VATATLGIVDTALEWLVERKRRTTVARVVAISGHSVPQIRQVVTDSQATDAAFTGRQRADDEAQSGASSAALARGGAT
jgi:hypothetical protein